MNIESEIARLFASFEDPTTHREIPSKKDQAESVPGNAATEENEKAEKASSRHQGGFGGGKSDAKEHA